MNKYNFLQYFYIVFLFFCLGLGIVKQGQLLGNLNNNKEALINNKGNSFRAVTVNYQAMSIYDGDTLRVVDNKGEELNLSSEFGVRSSEFFLDFFRDSYQNSDNNIDFLFKRFDFFLVNGF